MPSVRKNFVFSLIYEFLALAVPLITAPYLSRMLGPDGLGSYSLSYSIAYYFGMFAVLGMNKYGTRSIASVRDDQQAANRVFWELFFTQCLSSAISIAAYVAYAAYEDDLLIWIWVPYLASTCLDITWLFRGEENFKVTVVRNSLVKVLTACAIFLFVKNSNDVVLYAAITSIGYFVSQLLLWPYLKRYVKSFFFPHFRQLVSHFRPDAVLFVPLVAISVYRVFDKILIGVLSSDAQLGYFDCADKIIMVPLGIISALGAVMLPRISHMIASGDDRQVRHVIRLTMNFSMCLSIGLMFGILSVGQLFAVLYFGSNFAEVGPLLMCLGVTVPLIAWASVVREQYLVPSGFDNKYLAATVAGALLNVGLNVLVVPVFGAQGASVVTVATEALVCCMLSSAVKSTLDFRLFLLDALPFVAIGGFMYGTIAVIGNILPCDGLLLLIIEVAIGIGVYAGGLCVLCMASSKQRAMMLEMVSIRKS